MRAHLPGSSRSHCRRRTACGTWPDTMTPFTRAAAPVPSTPYAVPVPGNARAFGLRYATCAPELTAHEFHRASRRAGPPGRPGTGRGLGAVLARPSRKPDPVKRERRRDLPGVAPAAQIRGLLMQSTAQRRRRPESRTCGPGSTLPPARTCQPLRALRGSRSQRPGDARSTRSARLI